MFKRDWHRYYPEGIPYEIETPALSIFQLLESLEEKYFNHLAVIDRERAITYRELRTAAEQVAAKLAREGFKKGDRFALMLPNSIEYVVTFFAVHRLGGTIVQVNPMYQPHELDYILNDSQATWFIGYKEEKRKLDELELSDKMKAFYIDKEEEQPLTQLQEKGPIQLPETIIDLKEDIAILQYTGGTTGKPKGVMLTHSNLVANIKQTYTYAIDIYRESGHRLLGIAPMYHAMGMTSMILCLFTGGTYIALRRFEIAKVFELIRRHRPTLFLGSPTMYIALLNYPDFKEEDLRSFRLFVGGSAPMPVEVIRKTKEASGGLFIEGYGLSEATTSALRNPVKGMNKIGSIGIPTPSTDAKIVDLETGKDEIPSGGTGELIIKGPQVMKGYWNKPEETKDTIRDGWLYTGDIATKDEDGYFYIVGRKKEMIIAGGYNIYPVEIEDVLYEHPLVKEACVYGVPDAYRGETVKAVLSVKGSVDEEGIKEWCTKKLAKYKVPRIVEFRDELPRSTVGKILKRKLIEEDNALKEKVQVKSSNVKEG